MASGVMLIVCGPSGVGKSSLCARLLEEHPRLTMSVSYTTRDRRGAEVDGEAYHFVGSQRFEAMREDGAFAEWAEVHGNCYGTSRAVIEEAWERGQDLVFDIDYQGARQLKEAYPQSTAVLVVPPNLVVLEERLRGRGTDADEVIQGRLKAARHELEQYPMFDFIVENDEFEAAAKVFDAIYLAAGHARSIKAPVVDEMLR